MRSRWIVLAFSVVEHNETTYRDPKHGIKVFMRASRGALYINNGITLWV